ncbi:MAG: hypothetical protein JO032_20450 [Alphaproteobacteria bacterium]|nr:hypothetical protein [Alphaproteobacteria bacterium]
MRFGMAFGIAAAAPLWIGAAGAASYGVNAGATPAITPAMVTVPAPPNVIRGADGFTPQAFAPRGDLLDPWCKAAATAVTVANCADDALRARAIERLHAFDEARSRLSWDRQKALAADQNRWVAGLAQRCNLPDDAALPLPLEPALKDCLTREGNERLAFLEAYGAGAASEAGAPPAGPSHPDAAPAAKPAPASSAAAASGKPAGGAAAAIPAAPAAKPPPSQLLSAAEPPWVKKDGDAAKP